MRNTVAIYAIVRVSTIASERDRARKRKAREREREREREGMQRHRGLSRGGVIYGSRVGRMGSGYTGYV